MSQIDYTHSENVHTLEGPRVALPIILESVKANSLLDVGCGTGKATVLLAAKGLTGTALDGDPAMAGIASENLANFPGWQVQVCDFEKWEPPPAAAPFDLITCAQAWHWLDPDVRFHKANSLLRPGGWLALWWNRAGALTKIGRGVQAIYDEIAPEIASKSWIARDPGRTSDAAPRGVAFSAPIDKSYPWAKDYTADQWVALIRTQSDHRLLQPERLEKLTARVREFLLSQGGTYRHAYVCRMSVMQKR